MSSFHRCQTMFDLLLYDFESLLSTSFVFEWVSHGEATSEPEDFSSSSDLQAVIAKAKPPPPLAGSSIGLV